MQDLSNKSRSENKSAYVKCSIWPWEEGLNNKEALKLLKMPVEHSTSQRGWKERGDLGLHKELAPGQVAQAPVCKLEGQKFPKN